MQAFLFPGQGSQSVGMGKILTQENPFLEEYWERANDALGFDLRRVCFEGPEETLRDTRMAQPALMAVGVLYYAVVHRRGERAAMMAGHSLGEYTALVAAGALNFEDALTLVQKRAELMAAAPEGAMAALIGLSPEKLDEVLDEAKATGTVVVANYNSAGQVVVSGEVESVMAAMALARARGAKLAIKLPVSGAFHSPLMAQAGAQLAHFIDEAPLVDACVPIYQNTTALPATEKEELRSGLRGQMTGSVRWSQTMENMIGAGAATFYELGPGSVLAGLLKRIDKSIIVERLVFGDSTMDLTGRRAFITGARRGIGRAIALAYAQAGADCVLLARSAPEELAEEIRALGRQALPLAADVADAAAVEAAVKQAATTLGGLDILVNNAGITDDGLLMRMKLEQWQRVMDVNLSGAFYSTRAAARYLLKSPAGRIINITSVIGQMGNAGQANYAASKAGLIGFTRSVAREFGSRGITCNAIAPGFINTDMTAELDDEARETLLGKIPLAQLGEAEDVASLALFLASPGARYITGQVFNVDGGLVME